MAEWTGRWSPFRLHSFFFALVFKFGPFSLEIFFTFKNEAGIFFEVESFPPWMRHLLYCFLKQFLKCFQVFLSLMLAFVSDFGPLKVKAGSECLFNKAWVELAFKSMCKLESFREFDILGEVTVCDRF